VRKKNAIGHLALKWRGALLRGRGGIGCCALLSLVAVGEVLDAAGTLLFAGAITMTARLASVLFRGVSAAM
jgi:hypothetical protein